MAVAEDVGVGGGGAEPPGVVAALDPAQPGQVEEVDHARRRVLVQHADHVVGPAGQEQVVGVAGARGAGLGQVGRLDVGRHLPAPWPWAPLRRSITSVTASTISW